MVKVGVLAGVLLVIILAVTLAILLIGGSAALTSRFRWGPKKKDKEEKSDKNIEGPGGGSVGYGPGSGWV